MNKLKWIASAGGPLVLISDKSYRFWSGIFKRSAYLNNKIVEAHDYLNAAEADYGKACLVQDYLGVVNIGDDNALVLGDEPLMTTVARSADDRTVIARWHYGEDHTFVDGHLQTVDLDAINDWEFALTFTISSDRQYLFDAACTASMLDEEPDNYLLLDITQGNYNIWTSICEPDDRTKLTIQKFEKAK